MKNIKIIILVAFSLALSETLLCEAQYMEIFESINMGLDILSKVRDTLQPLALHKKNKTVDQYAVQNQKLDRLSVDIRALKQEMMENFKEVLKEVDQISGKVVAESTASTFESSMQHIELLLGNFIYKKKEVDENKLVLDKHFVREVEDDVKELKQFMNIIQIILKNKDISQSFLDNLKIHANVCDQKMSQLQLLNSFRALYVESVIRHLIGRHIAISLIDKADNVTSNDKKRHLNQNVRRNLQSTLDRFQGAMVSASREFQTCDNATSYARFYHNNEYDPCYFVGKDKLANTIVEYGRHFNETIRYVEYISLRPVTARPGYVVVGARIDRKLNILYLRIIEGKLLPNGGIDPKSITYNDYEPGIGEPVAPLFFNNYLSKNAIKEFDLTQTVAPDNRVITGLKFAITEDKKRFYLAVDSTEIDVDKGILDPKTTRSERHTKGTQAYKVELYHHDRRQTIIRNEQTGLQPFKPNQYVKLELSYPYFEIGDTYPTPLTLLSGASLYFKKVLGADGYLTIRLHTFNIVPHVNKIQFDVNNDFEDVLKSI